MDESKAELMAAVLWLSSGKPLTGAQLKHAREALGMSIDHAVNIFDVREEEWKNAELGKTELYGGLLRHLLLGLILWQLERHKCSAE